MKEKFVTYDIALKLKELGFDEPCLGIYDKNKSVYTNSDIDHFTSQKKVQYIFGNDKVKIILAPLWQDAIDWFRDKYNLAISITPSESNNYIAWYGRIYKFGPRYLGNTVDVLFSNSFELFKEVREQIILKALELCQNKK